MKVFFFITSSDSFANGGHFRSCLTIAEALNEKIDVEIVNIGKIKSPVLKDSKVKVTFVKINIYNFLFETFRIVRRFSKISDARLISFDFFSYFFVRHIGFYNKIPYGYVRCGGKNPKYSPHSETVFCFSKENYDYYLQNKLFKKSALYLLPNRVVKQKPNIKQTNLNQITKNNYFTILRIGRFVVNYEQVNLACIALSKFLNENRIAHNLIFIGYPDNPEASHFKNLKANIAGNSNVIILDTPEFTKNAAQFITDADLVIGTGRGAMESFVEGVPVAVYSSTNNFINVINNEKVFQESAAQNFSKRVKTSDISLEEAKSNLLSFFTNADYRQEIKFFQSKKGELFNIDFVVDNYISAFSEMKYDSTISLNSLNDYLQNFKIFILKLFYISKK